MFFSLQILLYIYYGFLAIWAFVMVVALYHMVKFGFKNFATFLSTAVFLCVAGVLLYYSFVYIHDIDWQHDISLFAGVLNGRSEFLPN